MVIGTNVVALINSNMNAFTNSELKVAEFILKDPKSVIYTSITDIAYQVQVGETTVLRFCRKLGFKGYQGFKITLAQGLEKTDEMYKELYDEITKNDSESDICKKVLNKGTLSLNETFDLIDYESFRRVLNYMIKAEKIFFFGVGDSAVTAMDAKARFMRVTNKTDAVMDSHFQSMQASLLTKKDLAIAFSYSGSTKDTVEILKAAKKSGAKTVCVTRFSKSPITNYADELLLIGVNENPLQGGAITSKIAQLYLIDILYVNYYIMTAQESFSNKEKTAESIVEKLY
jgi:DNA-binding MurR/RpiR family transcriptional regulator